MGLCFLQRRGRLLGHPRTQYFPIGRQITSTHGIESALNGVPSIARSTSLMVCTANGAESAICCAQSIAVVGKSADGTTALTRPWRIALPPSSGPARASPPQRYREPVGGASGWRPHREQCRAASPEAGKNMIRRNHQITRRDQLKAAADRVSVDSGNHRFVEMPHLSRPRKPPGKSASASTSCPTAAPTIQRLEIPSGGEDLLRSP